MAGQLVNGVGMSEIDCPWVGKGLRKLKGWTLSECSEVSNAAAFSRSTVLARYSSTMNSELGDK